MESLLNQMLEQIKYSPNFNETEERVIAALQLKNIFKKLYGVGTPQWEKMKEKFYDSNNDKDYFKTMAALGEEERIKKTIIDLMHSMEYGHK